VVFGVFGRNPPTKKKKRKKKKQEIGPLVK
jgi:hypothetical protein